MDSSASSPTPSPSASTVNDRPRGKFSCPECGHRFNRIDHLNRHRRCHNAQQTFLCPICEKSFTRGDSLTRHVRAHGEAMSQNSSSRRRASSRVPKACKYCAKSKLRCNGSHPCARCSAKDMECVYVDGQKTRISKDDRPSQSAAEVSQNHLAASDNNELSIDGGPTTIIVENPTDVEVRMVRLLSQAEGPPQLATPSSSHDQGMEDNSPQRIGDPDEPSSAPLGGVRHYVNDFGTSKQRGDDSCAPSDHGQGGAGNWAAYEGTSSDSILDSNANLRTQQSSGQEMDFDISAFSVDWDHNFDIGDWTTLESPYAIDLTTPLSLWGALPVDLPHPPYQDSFLPSEQNLPVHHARRPAGKQTAVQREVLEDGTYDSTRFESLHTENMMRSGFITGTDDTFHQFNSQEVSNDQRIRPGNRNDTPPDSEQWPTDWNPRQADNLISFPDMSGTPRDVLEAENFPHVQPLGRNNYEKILGIIAQASKEQKIFRPFHKSTLPSIEAFNCFVQLYFEYFQPIFPLLHQPSFNPSKSSWVLVLAVATIGCRYSKAPSSSHCAIALNELLRRAIMLTCETDNSSVREIWLTQAVVLNILGMMYSGDKRHLEIALVSRGSMVTQCRRNNALSQVSQPIDVGSEYQSHLLTGKWERWKREESYRRLGFCTWLLDCQLPLFFNTHPTMGLSELQQQLPCDEALWEAQDAQTWRDVILSSPGTFTTPNMQTTLLNLSHKNNVLPPLGSFARLLLVHALYITTWEIQQQSKNPLMNSMLMASSQNQMSSWRASTLSTLVGLQLDSNITVENSNLELTVQMHIQLVGLLLHTPFSDILVLAKSHINHHEKNCPRRKVLSWIEDDVGMTARRAVLHASVLFSLVRRNTCHGFHEPFALLIATLTIWAYLSLSPAEPVSDYYPVEPCSTLRLDKSWNDKAARNWIENPSNVRAHLTDVGNIRSPGAVHRVLQASCRSLLSMDIWTLSKGFANVITKLREHAAE